MATMAVVLDRNLFLAYYSSFLGEWSRERLHLTLSGRGSFNAGEGGEWRVELGNEWRGGEAHTPKI